MIREIVVDLAFSIMMDAFRLPDLDLDRLAKRKQAKKEVESKQPRPGQAPKVSNCCILCNIVAMNSDIAKLPLAVQSSRVRKATPLTDMLDTELAKRFEGPDRVFRATQLDHRFRQLVDYWTSKRVGDKLPGRRHIRPEELQSLLPYLLLYDIVTEPEGGHRFRVRLVGTHFVELLGKEISGRFLDETAYGPRYPELHQRLLTVIETRLPDFGIASLNNPERSFIQYGHLTLPLAEDGEHVDMLLGARISVDMMENPPAG